MKHVTINIPDNKFDAFMEVIKSLDYVKIEDVEEQSLEELQNSLKQVNLIKEGKIPKQNIQDFLDEL